MLALPAVKHRSQLENRIRCILDGWQSDPKPGGKWAWATAIAAVSLGAVMALIQALNKEEPVAHSTVQTLLRQLEKKGAIAHDLAERTFVFRPVVEEHKARKSATEEFIDRVFGGSFAGLVAHLLEHEKIPRKELQQIRKLIDEKES